MDPTRLLSNLRDGVAVLIRMVNDEGTPKEDIELVAEAVAEDFKNLDFWMTKGGFKPVQWGDFDGTRF